MNIERELRSKDRFDRAVDRLIEKTASNPWRRSAKPCSQAITLDWLIINRDRTISNLTSALKQKKFSFGPARLSIAHLDKERELIQRTWPERLVEYVIAGILHELLEPQLSPNLFSFRPGLSNHDAIKVLAGFVREARRNGKTVYISKRDIQDYGRSTPVELAMRRLEELCGPKEVYFLSLMRQLLNPLVRLPNGMQAIRPGSPTGSPIGPELDNLCLGELDKLFDSASSPLYLRYCDDIVISSTSPLEILQAVEMAEATVTKLGLVFRADKTQNCVFGDTPPEGFSTSRSLDYLGFSVSEHGFTFLSSQKVSDLKGTIRRTSRQAFNATRRLNHQSPEDVVATIIQSVNRVLHGPCAHDYARHIASFGDNQSEYRALDTWIAQQILAPVYGGSTARVFRHMPFRKLRELGLQSLRYARWKGETYGSHAS